MPDILIIDDDSNVHKLFDAFAQRLSCSALHALGGEKGEEMALTHKPVLVILDIMMPGQDGYITCRNLRGLGYKGAISMCSSLQEATGTKKIRECGANAYLMKPPDITVLGLHLDYARSGMKYETVSDWLQHL
jgi:two-component system OmpR family response regulator